MVIVRLQCYNIYYVQNIFEIYNNKYMIMFFNYNIYLYERRKERERELYLFVDICIYLCFYYFIFDLRQIQILFGFKRVFVCIYFELNYVMF